VSRELVASSKIMIKNVRIIVSIMVEGSIRQHENCQ
jgi:hypothetical protein